MLMKHHPTCLPLRIATNVHARNEKRKGSHHLHLPLTILLLLLSSLYPIFLLSRSFITITFLKQISLMTIPIATLPLTRCFRFPPHHGIERIPFQRYLLFHGEIILHPQLPFQLPPYHRLLKPSSLQVFDPVTSYT